VGREFDVIRIGKGKVWFMGDTGEECAAFFRECVIEKVEDEP